MSTGKDGEDSPATCSRQASGSTRERLAILQADFTGQFYRPGVITFRMKHSGLHYDFLSYKVLKNDT